MLPDHIIKLKNQMKTTKQVFLFLALILCPIAVSSQISIVKNGQPTARIIVDKNDSIDLRAALLLQDFTKRITGSTIDIVDKTSKAKSGDILIGNFQLPINKLDTSKITEDGFYLSSSDNYLRIVKGEGKGTIYGVVTLLEDYFNVRYYAADAYTLDKTSTMVVPKGIDRIDNPTFRYRQTQSYSLKDPIYRLWFRLEEPKDVFADNLWVHTFNHILPASEFGEKHPEYYAFVNGERRPGTASQWCLTNDDVFEIVSHRVDSIFQKNPGKNIISISQNDSQNYCTCDACKAINDHEGSPSGTIIYFLNKLATRFPDKEFSTLAYLYSVPPPKHIKPLPNVNIMLCDIDCYREVTLPENQSGQKFMTDMEGWAKISNNIFVWDYGINFDNYISPFPNFHILQPNMQLFKKNGATMHFSQISSGKGCDFSELRSYIVSKLLWNTEINVDTEIQSFLKGYYGEAAAPYLYQYLKLQEGALIGSNIPLWIYDTPITHKNGMLNDRMMRRYNILFDKAERATSDSTYQNRIREARLPIQYAELEIARTKPISPDEAVVMRAKLNSFQKTANEFGVEDLNERLNKINDYCVLYEKRNLSNNKTSLAYGAQIHYDILPNPPYDKIADKALTDGLYGSANYNESWVGWVAKDAEFTIDLGSVKDIKTVEADFLNHLGAWILLPKSMTCYTSVDNKDFKLMGKVDIPEDQDREVKYVGVPIQSSSKIKAQYIKVKIESIGLCPTWHYGVGYPAWFFLDEIVVY